MIAKLERQCSADLEAPVAELADAKSLRERLHPRRLRADRLRELIANRRRLAD